MARYPRGRQRARLALSVLVATAWACNAGFLDRPPPDALWQIVNECVGKLGPYCRCAAFARSCCGDADTPNEQVVWALTKDLVAIRDMRACGCGQGFVHGLAMPRSRVTGIEDPRRPEAIWPFAWRVAREHIPEEREVALVLNPASARTQNQMHVHIVRLTGDGRRLVDRPPPESARMKVGSLPDLSAVFAGVAGVVGTSAIGKQGVLIARAAAGDGWTMLLLENRSPEVYTEGSCRH